MPFLIYGTPFTFLSIKDYAFFMEGLTVDRLQSYRKEFPINRIIPNCHF